MKEKSTREIGDALENPVANIFRRLGYKVKQNCEIEGHQIDIYAEKKDDEYHTFRYAIDCKNYAKRVGIKQVAPSLKVFDDLRRKGCIDKGIIVSAVGFTKPAYNAVRGTEYVELHTFDDLLILLERKKRSGLDVREVEDWTAKYVPGITYRNLDEREISKVKEMIKKDKPNLAEYDDIDFLVALGLVDQDCSELRPNLACTLLLGKEKIIQRSLPQCEIVFLHYKDEQQYDRREDIKKPLLQTLERVMENISLYNLVETVKDGFHYKEVPIYPIGVIREALLNAVIHRSYEMSDAIYVKWYEDRVEISSPGGFLPGITKNNILYHPPRHRNRRLSEFFRQINRIERVGEGVNNIYRELLLYGKAPPEFIEYEDSVTIVIPKTKVDFDFHNFVKTNLDQRDRFFVDMLVILFYLKKNQKLAICDAEKLCQRDTEKVRRILSNLTARGFLESPDNTVFGLSIAGKTGLGLSVEKLKLTDETEVFKRRVESLYVESGYEVKHDVTISGYAVDIIVNQASGNRIFRIAVKCKYAKEQYVRKLDFVDDVSALSDLVRNKEVDAAAIVTDEGFTNDAFECATEYGVHLYTIKGLENMLRLGTEQKG